MDVIEEIERAVRSLALPAESCARLERDEAAAVLARIFERFTDDGGDGWWWERLRDPVCWQDPDGRGFERISAVVPDPQEAVLFAVDTDDALELYASTPATAALVIGECFAFEYFLVPRDLGWLLGENHHNVLVGVGEPVATRLRLLAN